MLPKMQPNPFLPAAVALCCAMAPISAQGNAAGAAPTPPAPTPPAPTQGPTDPVERLATTREALQKWVETRRLISAETNEWRLGRDSIEARAAVVEREIESLRQRIAEAKASIGTAEQKRTELQAENERRKAVAAGLEQRIEALEQRAVALLARAPEPLQDKVRPLSQRLPKAGEPASAAKASLSERYQNVVGVLNEIAKWNREITVTSELRPLANGQKVDVAVIYVGLGQAWYVGTNGKVAGIGTSTPTGWSWRAADELAPQVAAAIAVFKSERPAALIRLPVQIL
jgi:hypothetical protein